jgi:peptidoglycan/xylan/chitin deacetylase (PgdA/CDA1 family)
MSNPGVLSVDLEFFEHTPAVRGADGALTRSGVGLSGVEFLLDAFEKTDVSATFFVVSEIARDHPELVDRIVDEGHEIASHTHTHHLLSDLAPGSRRSEYKRSRNLLEDVSGTEIDGFRAPAFDIPENHFDHLEECGYSYDSSIVSARRIPGWYGGEYDVHTPCLSSKFTAKGNNRITEIPVSVMPYVRLPISGAWIRLLGRRYTRLGINWLQRRGITPVLYVHPWEFVDLPRIDGVPSRVYWRTGRWMRQTLRSLLRELPECTTMCEIVTGTER